MASITPRRTAGVPQDPAYVLAQIPDLDPQVAPKSRPKPTDGRIISQSLSMKVVFGLGLALVIGAILVPVVPWVVNKLRTKPVEELKTWEARNSEPSIAPNTVPSVPPQCPAAPPQTVVVPPQAPALGISPPPPQLGDYRPAAMSGPSWTPPRPASGYPAAAPRQANNGDQGPARFDPPSAHPDDRNYGAAADPRNLQADRRSDPAMHYGNDTGVDYRGNPVDSGPSNRNGQTPNPTRGDRYDATTNPTPTGGVPAQWVGSPLMPAGNNNAGGYRSQQESEPGVARFEGTIDTPPGRTNP
jgi:hypothetical protein